MDELPIGRRVAYWRGRRKLSQQVFADRLGKSKSWVDKVERGVRRLDKFSVLYEIADVLTIDVQLLLGKDPERRTDALNCIDEVEVEEIRTALERYVSMSKYFDAQVVPPALPEFRKAVSHAWLTYQYARYGVLTRALPKLLRDAQAADAYYTGDDGQLAASLLGQVYQIASSALRKLGEHELAWLAADRSMAVSVRADDPLLAGVATYRVGNALLALGRARSALEVNVNIANRLAPGGSNGTDPDRLSVYGMLLLQGAMAAARLGDNSTVKRPDPGRRGGGQRARLGPELLLDQFRADQPGAAPGRGGGGAGRGPAGGGDPRAADRQAEVRGPAARAAGPPLARHRPRVRPDRRRVQRGRDAGRRRSTGPVGDPLPADRARGHVRHPPSHTGCAAGADRGVG